MKTHQQRRILWALALTQVFGTLGVGTAPTIGVLLASEVTQNEALAGIARTASTFVAASALFAASLPAESRTQAAGGLDSLTNLGAATAALASGFIMAATSFPTLVCIAALALVPSLVLTRPLRENQVL